MAFLEWRKFNFFDLKKESDDGKIAKILKESKVNTISTWSNSENSVIILGTSSGHVHLVSRSWQTQTFQAYDKTVLLSDAQYPNILVTIGEDELNICLMKVWNLLQLTKTGAPVCLRIYKLQSIDRKPTCISLGEAGRLLAIGYDNGTIDLYRGDVARDRTKVKTLIANNGIIHGLSFKAVTKCVHLFINSSEGVLVYTLTGRDSESKFNLDKAECNPGYCSPSERSNEDHSDFMVGRNDAVYCYSAEGRGPCFAVKGEKKSLHWFRSHLVILSDSKQSTNTSKNSKLLLTVLDIENKFIVFSSLVDDFEHIFTEWGSCYIMTKNKEIWHLDEKDLQSKLSLLFKKNLYDVAIKIAKKQQYDSDSLSDIFRQYGDHLYVKGDFASAIDQYIKTIGCLEPSYVIKRFLSSQHIDYLTSYLQALHRQGYASGDHTTLLLNCFTRLDQPEQLAKFLKAGDRDLDFDVDVAIHVCRTASIDQALTLAKKHEKHDLCLKILLGDMKNYSQGLHYIECLDFENATKYINVYGTVLLQIIPKETTDFLKKLCTEHYPRSKLLIDRQLVDDNIFCKNRNRANPEDYIHLFHDNSGFLIEFLEYLISVLTTCDTFVYNTLLEQYLQIWASNNELLINENRILEILKDKKALYDEHHVLVLCHTHKFYQGLLYLYEKTKMYELIIRHSLKRKDYNNVLNVCRRLGLAQPTLWLQSLWGICRNQDAPKAIVAEMLQFIAKEHLQSPLQVLDCLSIADGPFLKTVREYFLDVFQQEDDNTKEANDLINVYRSESERIKKNLVKMLEGSIVFRGTRCSACNHPLEIPSIHFLCHHVFHQHCYQSFSENDLECPACLHNNKQVLDLLCSQMNCRTLHDSFHRALVQSEDSFLQMAEYFSKGVFKKVFVKKEKEFVVSKNINTYNKELALEQGIKENFSNAMLNHCTQTTIDLSERNRAPEIEQTGFEDRIRQYENKSNPCYSSLEAHISDINQCQFLTNFGQFSPVTIHPDNNAQSNEILTELYNKKQFCEEYDESKNPFADETILDSRNPFDDNDDYDKNLNPFET